MAELSEPLLQGTGSGYARKIVTLFLVVGMGLVIIPNAHRFATSEMRDYAINLPFATSPFGIKGTRMVPAQRFPARTSASGVPSSRVSGFMPAIQAGSFPLQYSDPAAAGRLSTVITRAERVPVNSEQDELKRQVGYKAVDDYVKSGTTIGLGTGSTAAFAVERVGDKLASGELKDIKAIPTSVRTKEQAESLGIPLTTLDKDPDLDVAIDGADDVDKDLNLVKGGGGALLREKMVEVMADKFIVIVDESKISKTGGLGPAFPIPVEIVQFEYAHTMNVIGKLPALAGCKPVLRMGSSANNQPDGPDPAVTDNGNYIVDLFFDEPIKDVPAAATALKNTVGVVDHGLFIGMTTACIVAGKDGIVVKT